MVHGNAVFIGEEAKEARNTHRYTFSRETSLLSTPLTSLSIKQTILWAARNYLLTCSTIKSPKSSS